MACRIELPALACFAAAAVPELTVVLDHGAKPEIADGTLEPWATAIRQLAARPNTACKLSGLVTEAAAGSAVAAFTPFADVILSAFGAGRVMFGSDWPVCLLASDYAGELGLARALVSGLSEAERAAVFAGTAAWVYRIAGRRRRPRIWRRGVALTDEAIEKIKQMIISGRVRPGEKLPREADLAAELGLSRNSLREAVKALSLINVLDVRQGDGTYATSLAPSLLLEALSFVVDFHRDDTVLDFLEIRRILEPAATALAAVRMPDEDRIELGKVLDAADASAPVDEFVAADMEFHRLIGVGSGNSVLLASLVDNISVPTARARVCGAAAVTEPRAQERTLAEHRAIYQAIVSRDADLARSWANVHIAGIESWLRTALAD